MVDTTPEKIGPYRILEPIGEGGMGQVYVAERREPVRQKVAIKVIKPGMDSREVLARFDAERHALALMDHHNVSRVIDAGMMENGRPYFVMELVLGHPITEFCDRNHLAIEDRLELFYQVCRGVQHAHQKGVIHRDIKPSNVIVTVNNQEPIPKIIDFGIAKAMGAELTQKTYFTYAGQIIGTPHYMSPEQAESHPTDVDTRSDIYSLGVLLYELLTGRTPLTKEDFKEAGLEQMLQMIRVSEPVRPSTAITKLEQEKITTVSENRRATARRLSHVLTGDLDWMVMKALEKDRSRRYETANAFAMDVRRYLRGETITATPPTLRYQMRKFAKRHKGPLIASSLITCSLVAGLIASLWQADRARFEAKRAKEAEQVAINAAVEALEEREKARKQKEIAEEQERVSEKRS